jgi:hypothetical protein
MTTGYFFDNEKQCKSIRYHSHIPQEAYLPIMDFQAKRQEIFG